MENPFSSAKAHLARKIHDKEVHIRNLEAIIRQRDQEIESLQSQLPDSALAEASRARTRQFWQPPPFVPPTPAQPAPSFGARLKNAVVGKFVASHWMQIGVLRQYAPRPIRPESFPPPRLPESRLPQVAIVTPSFNQARFLEATLRSVLDQNYPRLAYVVEDGGSSDGSPALIAAHAGRLAHWASAPDQGQADAIVRGFARVAATLGPDDLMGYLNSDDLIMPGALRYVAEYFARHPEVDAVYGHRVIIDDDAREVGRWVLPRHEPRALEWIDYVPQETLFWRKRAWDRVGGLDPSFHFALDWDLLARFTEAGLRLVRLPRFLGLFRVHEAQKTSQHIHSTGAEEMARVRARFRPAEKADEMASIEAWAQRTRWRGSLASRLLTLGIRR